MDILFEQLYYEIMEGYKVATCQRGYFRDCSNDKDALKECQSYGNIVKNARETHQKNSFGHGLILLKLSDIEEKLENLDIAAELKKSGKDIVTKCIGTENMNRYQLLKSM